MRPVKVVPNNSDGDHCDFSLLQIGRYFSYLRCWRGKQNVGQYDFYLQYHTIRYVTP